MVRTVRRVSRRPRRCGCGNTIPKGTAYLSIVMSPGHDGIAPRGWSRADECAACATRYGRSHILNPPPLTPQHDGGGDG